MSVHVGKYCFGRIAVNNLTQGSETYNTFFLLAVVAVPVFGMDYFRIRSLALNLTNFFLRHEKNIATPLDIQNAIIIIATD